MPAASVFAAGVGLGASLIIAIGAQNAFVLRQGIRRDHVFAVVVTCVLCDWALIAAGAAGFGALIGAFPFVTRVAAWAGAAFLVAYGALALRSAFKPAVLHAEKPAATAHAGAAGAAGPAVTATSAATVPTVRAAVIATLAVSLLNPHVYLDTVVLLGGLAAQYAAPMRLWFALGAMLASALWFAGLGFGARFLAPVFERPTAWRALDVAVGAVMWWIAAGLVLAQLR